MSVNNADSMSVRKEGEVIVARSFPSASLTVFFHYRRR
jgi:hypothetical protein